MSEQQPFNPELTYADFQAAQNDMARYMCRWSHLEDGIDDEPCATIAIRTLKEGIMNGDLPSNVLSWHYDVLENIDVAFRVNVVNLIEHMIENVEMDDVWRKQLQNFNPKDLADSIQQSARAYDCNSRVHVFVPANSDAYTECTLTVYCWVN